MHWLVDTLIFSGTTRFDLKNDQYQSKSSRKLRIEGPTFIHRVRGWEIWQKPAGLRFIVHIFHRCCRIGWWEWSGTSVKMSIFECNHTIAAWHLQDLQGCSRAWWWRCNWQNTLLGVPPASSQSPWSSRFGILDCGRFRLSWRSLGHLRQVIFLTDCIVTTNVCIANNNHPLLLCRTVFPGGQAALAPPPGIREGCKGRG